MEKIGTRSVKKNLDLYIDKHWTCKLQETRYISGLTISFLPDQQGEKNKCQTHGGNNWRQHHHLDWARDLWPALSFHNRGTTGYTCRICKHGSHRSTSRGPIARHQSLQSSCLGIQPPQFPSSMSRLVTQQDAFELCGLLIN